MALLVWGDHAEQGKGLQLWSLKGGDSNPMGPVGLRRSWLVFVLAGDLKQGVPLSAL